MTNASNKTTSAVDRLIGRRIRVRRLEIGLAQTALADAIGVTFQQVQKYEKGINRVSAATLLKIAEVLRIPVASLFPNDTALSEASPALEDSSDLTALRVTFAKLGEPSRRVLLRTSRVLLEEEGASSKERT